MKKHYHGFLEPLFFDENGGESTLSYLEVGERTKLLVVSSGGILEHLESILEGTLNEKEEILFLAKIMSIPKGEHFSKSLPKEDQDQRTFRPANHSVYPIKRG